MIHSDASPGVHKLRGMNTTRPRPKVSDIAPTTLRLPPDVRDQLMREATISNRSLSQEITYRLQCSLAPQKATQARAEAQESTPLAGSYQALADEQRLLLSLYGALAPDKQLALITLLRR
jgi:hypothetical protein